MTRPDLPQLDYDQAPPGSARWAIASLAVAGGSHMFVFGVTVVERCTLGPLGAGLPKFIVLILIGLVVVFAPVAGVTFGALGLGRDMQRRGLALLGILANLSVWVVIFLMWLIPSS